MSVTYDRLDVTVQFDDQIQGGTPITEEAMRAWGEFKGLSSQQVEENVASLPGLEDEQAEPPTITGFLRDEFGLYVNDITWKAHLKDMLSRLGIFQTQRGSKNEAHFGLIIRPARVRFMENGAAVIERPHGVHSAVAHITGPQGRRSALKYTEYLRGVQCAFSVYLLRPHSKLRLEHIEDALAAGQEYGYGANRTMGFGRYTVLSTQGQVEVKLKPGKRL